MKYLPILILIIAVLIIDNYQKATGNIPLIFSEICKSGILRILVLVIIAFLVQCKQWQFWLSLLYMYILCQCSSITNTENFDGIHGYKGKEYSPINKTDRIVVNTNRKHELKQRSKSHVNFLSKDNPHGKALHEKQGIPTMPDLKETNHTNNIIKN